MDDAQPNEKPTRAATLSPVSWWAVIGEILLAFVLFQVIALAILWPTRAFWLAALATPLTVAALSPLLWRRGESWAALGLRRPQSWPTCIAAGVGMAAAALAEMIALEPVLARQFGGVDNAAFAKMFADPWVRLYMLTVGAWVCQGLGEELLFRGFILTRLAQMFRLRPGGWAAAVVLQAGLFGALHAYQGPAGIIVTSLAGLIFGAGYLACRRNLWPCIIAHGLSGMFLTVYSS